MRTPSRDAARSEAPKTQIPQARTAAEYPPAALRRPLLRGQLLALQRQAGNKAAAAVVKRDGSTGDVETKEGILDGVRITTYADGALFLTDRTAALDAERAAVLGDGVPAPPELFNAAFEGRQLLANVRAGGILAIDAVTYDQVDDWFGKYAAAMTAGEAVRTLGAAAKMRNIANAARTAAASMEQARAAQEDKKAAAFAADDDSALSALWNWSTALYDSALAAKPLIENASAMERELVTQGLAALQQAGPSAGRGRPSYKVPPASKALEVAEKANAFIASIQLVTAAAHLASAQKTEAAKARATVSDAVAIASAAGTLIGASASISLQLNLMIGPMTDACLKALEKLENVAKNISLRAIERGDYDKVDWTLLPGGRPVFDFMLAVRSAGEASGVPSPVPKAVASYFVDQRGDLEAGSSGGTLEMPTTGFWLWRKVDQTKISNWVFSNRDSLWAMFYGSTRPNAMA